VRAISQIADGTKGQSDLTTIGRFGIGFKSVYAYTDVPQVHSTGDITRSRDEEHFLIRDYICPDACPAKALQPGKTTLFVLPFQGNERPDPDNAVSEIANRLRNLDVRTMLFLKHIAHIEWSISGTGEYGAYLRETEQWGRVCPRKINPRGQSEYRVSLTGESSNGPDETETWLVFSRTFDDANPEARPIEVAFLVRQEEATKAGEKTSKWQIQPLSSRSKEGSSLRSPVNVVFPTGRDTRLGFLIQGPYLTTPTREDIIDHDFNDMLVTKTAALVADSLEYVKDMGLLDVSALRSLPIDPDDFPMKSTFYPIYRDVNDKLRCGCLLPSHDGKSVSATQACLTDGAPLRNLMTPKDLASWARHADRHAWPPSQELHWLSGEISKAQAQTQVLWRYVRQKLNVPEIDGERLVLDATDMFFASQPDMWLKEFYIFLANRDNLRRMLTRRNAAFIRVESGATVRLCNTDNNVTVHLDDADHPDRSIKASLVDNTAVEQMFVNMGVQPPNPVSDVMSDVLPLYKGGNPPKSLEEHLRHIEQIQRALAEQEVDVALYKQLRRKLLHTPFVRTETTQSEVYRKPGEVYVNNQETELYFKGNPDVAFVTREYRDNFVNMLIDELKVRSKPHVEYCRTPEPGGFITVTSVHGHHERGLNGFDPRCQLDGLAHALKHPTLDRSTYIWREIAIPYLKQIEGQVERSTTKTFANSSITPKSSPFGRMLKKCPWLPKPTGGFSLPKDISLDELPEDFRRDMEGESSGLAQKLGMEDSNPSSELDGKFPTDIIKFAEDLKKLSPEDKRRMLSIIQI